jgi:hypothetical protein
MDHLNTECQALMSATNGNLTALELNENENLNLAQP